MIGLGVVGTSLYAITALPPMMRLRQTAEVEVPHALPFAWPRPGTPPEMTWFFLKFPYLSRDVQVVALDRHTYKVRDGKRGKDYVVRLSQVQRRVEVYSRQDPGRVLIRVFSLGSMREVVMEKGLVTGDRTLRDGNLWMWERPLWNEQHLKIYGLTDLWLNAPYKRYSCAGFVHQFLGDAGISVPVLDAWDMARLPWTRVPREELEPGDIVTIRAASPEHRRFWGHRITHVGVYIGNGKLIHASTATRKARRSFVKIADIDDFAGRIDRILRPPQLL